MITKYKQYNESIKSLLVGPTKDEMWKNLGYNISFNTYIEYMNYLINNLEIKNLEEDDNKIGVFLNGNCLFLQDNENEILLVDRKVFNILHNVFGLRIKEINNLLYDKMGKFLEWDGFLIQF